MSPPPPSFLSSITRRLLRLVRKRMTHRLCYDCYRITTIAVERPLLRYAYYPPYPYCHCACYHVTASTVTKGRGVMWQYSLWRWCAPSRHRGLQHRGNTCPGSRSRTSKLKCENAWWVCPSGEEYRFSGEIWGKRRVGKTGRKGEGVRKREREVKPE